MFRFLSIFLFLASCGAPTLPDVDPQQEYTDAVARLGLYPVYPPRQSVRVGDVYFIVKKNSRNPNDLVYLGHLQNYERYAADYDAGALPIYMSPTTNAAAGQNQPFSGKGSVMPIAFPSIALSAASTAALGSTLPGGSGFLNFGRARSVSIGFENTREFGLPRNVLPPESVYRSQLDSMISR